MREHPRAPMDTCILIKRGDREIKIHSKNISIGGLGIEYTANLTEYEGEMHIFFNLPGTPFQIRAMAEIRWVDDGMGNPERKGMGLKLYNLDAKSIERINQYVKRNMNSIKNKKICPYCGMEYRWHPRIICYICNNIIE